MFCAVIDINKVAASKVKRSNIYTICYTYVGPLNIVTIFMRSDETSDQCRISMYT